MYLKLKPFSDEIKKLYENHAHFHDGDGGLDLYVVKNQIINAKSTALIHLGIACETKEFIPYFLMARSSISKTPLRLSNSLGLIDAGYRGEIMASVDNIRNVNYEVKVGQRLFQLVAINGSPIQLRLVEGLSTADRDIGGFGSTGE